MATINYKTCDRCKVRLDTKNTQKLGKLEYTYYETTGIIMSFFHSVRKDYDFCDVCFQKAIDVIEYFCQKV